MRRIMVTGAGGTASMNFIKCLSAPLARETYFILGIDTNEYQLNTSKNCSARIVGPSIDDPSWLGKIQVLLMKYGIEFINFQTDVELLKAVESPALWPFILVPEEIKIRLCQNKLLCARKLNTYAPLTGPFDIETFYGLQVRRPRPNSKIWMRAIKGAGSRAALPVTSWPMASAWAEYWNQKAKMNWADFMLSEYLPGKEYAWQSLWYRGTLVASYARERVQYMFGGIMPSGQSSSPSVARSIHNPFVNQTGYRAIKTVDPEANGVYGVDMKEDGNGVALVTEINAGRFYTTSDFAAVAGTNLVEAYVDLFYNRQTGVPVSEYDCIPANLLWVRGVDKEPTIIKE